MLKRTRRTLWIVAVVLLLLAGAIYLRSKAPPEAARVLPESDGILYLNLRPARAFLSKDLKNLHPIKRDPAYQQFIDATGIDWERDLDEAAIALHRMPDPHGPNGPVAYSMVLMGRIDGKRLANFLAQHASAQEDYSGHTIYSLPSEGRTVRVSQVGYDMVAISNFPTPEQIHSMLERHRTAALPFTSSTLLTAHYHEIPLLSVAWGMGQIGLPFSDNGKISVLGLELPIEQDSTLLASVRVNPVGTPTLRLRVEEITPTGAAAESQANSLNAIVTLARNVTGGLASNPVNDGLREVLGTTRVEEHNERVVVTANLPASSVGKLITAQ